MSKKIEKILARQILDSRGNPTVEAEVWCENSVVGIAAVPSGASTGSREALELRDGTKDFEGKSVHKAIFNIENKIAPMLLGKNIFDQEVIDKQMIDLDGTENKSSLGANAMLAVSLACARAGASSCNKKLFQYLQEDLKAPRFLKDQIMPAPLMNIINGGAHASNNLDIQEFMIVPHLANTFSRNLQAGAEVFHCLKKVLSKAGHSTNVGDEGGFAPSFNSHEEAIEVIIKAIELAGYKVSEQISISLDAAASEFYQKEKRNYLFEGKNRSTDEMIEYYENLVKKYPIYSIEDGLDESDFSGWIALTKKLGSKILTVGDDLFVTNTKILRRGIEEKQANAILVKVNQIGTLSETFEAMKLAFDHGFKAIISHRSGETADSFIADLAVATSCGHIKTGSASRSDRVEKYNQLLRIEQYLGGKAKFYKIK